MYQPSNLTNPINATNHEIQDVCTKQTDFKFVTFRTSLYRYPRYLKKCISFRVPDPIEVWNEWWTLYHRPCSALLVTQHQPGDWSRLTIDLDEHHRYWSRHRSGNRIRRTPSLKKRTDGMYIERKYYLRYIDVYPNIVHVINNTYEFKSDYPNTCDLIDCDTSVTSNDELGCIFRLCEIPHCHYENTIFFTKFPFLDRL